MKALDVGPPDAAMSHPYVRFIRSRSDLRQDIIPKNVPFSSLFLDLLQRIFVYDPAHRITAKQALLHPWFKEAANADDGTEAAKIRMERIRTSEEATSRTHS